jgi:hypothetical protein
MAFQVEEAASAARRVEFFRQPVSNEFVVAINFTDVDRRNGLCQSSNRRRICDFSVGGCRTRVKVYVSLVFDLLERVLSWRSCNES